MSFICLACGRQRAGGSGFVCRECQGTDMGRAAIFLPHFAILDEEPIQVLQKILDGPSSDGSITNRRRIRLLELVRAARTYRDALDAVTPQSHQEDW